MKAPLTMIRRKIKPDGKCLFTSIGYAMERSMDLSSKLRNIVATEIANDPVKFNEEVLTMPNADYVAYILKPSTWGSANEIDILSQHYKTCISVIKIKNMEVESFGQVNIIQLMI